MIVWQMKISILTIPEMTTLSVSALMRKMCLICFLHQDIRIQSLPYCCKITVMVMFTVYMVIEGKYLILMLSATIHKVIRIKSRLVRVILRSQITEAAQFMVCTRIFPILRNIKRLSTLQVIMTVRLTVISILRIPVVILTAY